MKSLRLLIRRRLARLPHTLLNLGAFLTALGRVFQITYEYEEALRRTQRRMRAEDLVKGRDNARAQVILTEELLQYRTEFEEKIAKFEISALEEIDPWRDFDSSAQKEKNKPG